MGQCLGKEKQRVSENGDKKKRKHNKSSLREIRPQSVQSPHSSRETRGSAVGMSSSSNSDRRSSVDDPPAAETFSMEYKHLERKNSVNKLARVCVSEGNTHVSSELHTPVGSDDQCVSPFSPRLDSKRGKSSPMRRMFNSPKLAPRVLFKSPLPKHLSSLRREKNNSTSSMYIRDTINAPNIDEVIKCMAIALQYHIKNGMEQPDGNVDRVFSEIYHPLTRELLDLINLPDVSTIYRYVNMIFQVQKLHAECAILCLAYIERVLSTNRIVLHPENWRRIVFGSILIATKVWEDESVWNVDFLDVFPLLTLVDLNNIENKFMELLQFNVLIIGSEYAKYYFELRALSQQESFPLEPLNKETQARLEQRAQRTNEQVSKLAVTSFRGVAVKRARSVDFFDPKSPTAVLA